MFNKFLCDISRHDRDNANNNSPKQSYIIIRNLDKFISTVQSVFSSNSSISQLPVKYRALNHSRRSLASRTRVSAGSFTSSANILSNKSKCFSSGQSMDAKVSQQGFRSHAREEGFSSNDREQIASFDPQTHHTRYSELLSMKC
jgi:hypothetical protein